MRTPGYTLWTAVRHHHLSSKRIPALLRMSTMYFMFSSSKRRSRPRLQQRTLEGGESGYRRLCPRQDSNLRHTV